jgi:gliding motility-associated-like protein
MYETTNIIDVVVKRRKNATGWQNNLGIIGLIDGTGLQAKAAPGRNRNDVWQSLTGEAWRFIPAGIAKYTLKWYKNGAFLSEELNPTILPNGQVQSNISVPPVDGDFYTAKLVIQPVTAGDPTYNLEDTYVVNINATKFKKPVDVTVCGTDSNGDFVFNINQNTYMANGANAGNFDFGYYNSLQEAKDLASPINDSAPLVLSATTSFPKTIYVNANDIATGCSTLLTFDLYGKKSPEGTFSYTDDGGEIGFCRSSNTALAPTPSVVFSPDGVYTVDPPFGLSINSNTGVLDLTDALPGNYTIIYKIAATESCPEYSTTATVKINLCTDLQIPAVACEDSIFTLSTTNAGSGVTYTWSDANGVITNTYETSTVNILAPATSGSYSYIVVASVGTENSLPSSENLEVVNSPDATILTTTPGVCVGNPASIAITSSPGAIVKYTVDGVPQIPITIEADGTNEITVNPATPQSVYQLVSAENPTSPSCTKTYTATSPNSNVTIITGEPAATISVSGTNPICTNSTSVIRFTGNGGATVHYSKNGVGDFTALIDATTGFVDVTTDVLTTSTDYDLMSIVVSGTNPCIKNYPSGSAKVTVIVNPLPTITSFSTTTAFICTNTKGSLTISGTANCNVVFTDGITTFPAVLIGNAGSVTIPTPNNLTAATTFSLVSITTNDALACSTTGLSQNVLIQISNGPSITAQPQSTTTICEGAADAVLSITAIGASLSYLWNDGTNNVGTNSNTLNVSATLINDGKSYTCTVTDACGVFVDSAIATVNVTAKPVFTQQTQGTSPICAGANIDLTVIATGVGVTYKWFRGTTDLSTSNPTALTSNLVITNAQPTDSGVYKCEATTCSSVNSNDLTITVNPLPVVTGFSAADAAICSGTKGNLIFSGTPNSTIVYSDGTTNTFTATTDAFGSANIFTTNNLTTPTTFTLVSIKDNLTSCINTTFTNILPVTIGINALPTVGNPTTATATLICSGDPATILSVVATGSGLTYVWKKDSSIVLNSNSNSITVPSIAANTGNYSCTVTDVCGQTVITTIPLSLIINDAPIITQATAGSTICSGTTINLSIATTGIGLTYQWKKNGVDLPITNTTTTSSSLVIVNAQTTDSGDYTCEAKSGTCSVTSPIAAMIVNQAPQVITQPISNVYCSGDDITLSVGVSIPTVTYQWQFNGTDISGETNFELQLTNVNTANSGDYVCLINNLPCKQIKSNKAVILVKAAPFATIQTQTPSTTVCAGTDSNLIFNGTPNAKVTYTINGGANQVLSLSPSGITTIITTGILETTTTYQLVSISTNDFSPVCTATLTDSVTINVVDIPEPTLTEDGFICVDENNVTQRKFRMETGLSGSNYDFQWYEDNVAIAAPAGTTDFYDADKATTYTVEITDNTTGCQRSAMTKITSSLQPKTVTATVLSGYFDDNATIEIKVDPINGDYEYQLDFGPFQDSNIFSNVPSGDHNVYARDKRECNTTAAFSIKITNYPKFFTPNGDGINDYWNIFNLSNQINAKIYIFDRFGKFMKQISTTGQGWDGNFNTKPAAADDYWFVIKYEEQTINKEFKAHFTLKR